MKRDYSFLNYMLDKNGEIPENLEQGLLLRWVGYGGAYYETEKYEYYMYKFEDSRAGILSRVIKGKENHITFDDFQPIVFSSESVKCQLVDINEDDGLCTLLVDDNCYIVASMDSMGFKRNDELYVHLNLSTGLIEFSRNEEEYKKLLLPVSEKDDFNIFNIPIGELIPPVKFMKIRPQDFPHLDDDFLKKHPDNFMVGSGNFISFSELEPKMKTDDGDIIPLGSCTNIEMKTSFGVVSAIIKNEILKKSIDEIGIDNLKGAEADKIIVKMYGIMGAFIDIEKTKGIKVDYSVPTTLNLEKIMPQKIADYDVMFHDAIGMLFNKKNIYKELAEWLNAQEEKVDTDVAMTKALEFVFGSAEETEKNLNNEQNNLLPIIENTFKFSKEVAIYLVALLPVNQITNFISWKEKSVISQQKNGRVFDIRQLVNMILCGFFEKPIKG